MKTIIAMAVAAGLGLCTLSAEAAWRCQSSNHHGQSWYAVGATRGYAASYAMQLCHVNSWHGGRSCGIDYCRTSHPSYGRWQCTVVGAKGGVWVGVGMSKSSARATALNYCYVNSRHPNHCYVRSCFVR